MRRPTPPADPLRDAYDPDFAAWLRRAPAGDPRRWRHLTPAQRVVLLGARTPTIADGLRYAPASWGLTSIWMEDSLTADLIGSNTLTTHGGPTLSAGQQGQGGLFDSALSQYCDIASNSSLQLGQVPWVFTAWVRPDSVATRMAIFAKGGDVTAEYSLQLRSSKGNVFFELANSWGSVATDNGILAATTYFLAGTWDAAGGGANSLTIYLNGVLAQTGNVFPDEATHTNPFYVARVGLSATPFYWKGLINQITLWKPSSASLLSTIVSGVWNGGAGLPA